MKADFKISSKDIINEYKSASSKSAVGKILGISYSKVVKTLLSAGIDIEESYLKFVSTTFFCFMGMSKKGLLVL